jgi:hypothetical protein
MGIIRTEPGLEFWKNMSLQELGAKGKRGKELRLVLPSGHEDMVSCAESDAESESEQEDGDGDGADNEDEDKKDPSDHVEPHTEAAPSSNEQTTIRSFSDPRPSQGVQFRQTLGSLQDVKPAGSASESISFADRESSSFRKTQQFHPCLPLVPPTSSTLPTSSTTNAPQTTMTQNMVPKVENDTRFVKFWFQFSLRIY